MADIPALGHLKLVIVTPEGSVVHTDVTELVAPGVLGEFGVLPGHLPFLSAMSAGVVTYVEDGHTGMLAVGPGYVQVGQDDQVVMLTESALRPEEIDFDAAGREEREADAALVALSAAEQAGEFAHQAARVAWARARREAVERQRAKAGVP
jgi:F-type H+-transporting ATPase subunit epsilon